MRPGSEGEGTPLGPHLGHHLHTEAGITTLLQAGGRFHRGGHVREGSGGERGVLRPAVRGGGVVVLATRHLERAAERDAAARAAGLVVLRACPVGALAALLLAAEQVALHVQLPLALSARHERVTYGQRGHGRAAHNTLAAGRSFLPHSGFQSLSSTTSCYSERLVQVDGPHQLSFRSSCLTNTASILLASLN